MKPEKLEHNIYSRGEYYMKPEKLEHNIYSRGEYNMKPEKLEHNIYSRGEYNMKPEKLGHNIYSRGEYNMKPEKLEDLFNTEHYDVILVTLKELAEKRRETNREIVSRQFDPLFERCPFSGYIIGCCN